LNLGGGAPHARPVRMGRRSPAARPVCIGECPQSSPRAAPAARERRGCTQARRGTRGCLISCASADSSARAGADMLKHERFHGLRPPRRVNSDTPPAVPRLSPGGAGGLNGPSGFPFPRSALPVPLFPVPRSLFPVPGSPFPVPRSLFPVPCFPFPVPGSRHSVTFFTFISRIFAK
jgi:hypothetical protein